MTSKNVMTTDDELSMQTNFNQSIFLKHNFKTKEFMENKHLCHCYKILIFNRIIDIR